MRAAGAPLARAPAARQGDPELQALVARIVAVAASRRQRPFDAALARREAALRRELRAHGVGARELGVSPRQLGTNPRRLRAARRVVP